MISGFPLGETAAWSLAISTPRRFGVLIRAGNGGQGGTAMLASLATLALWNL
jgi:hypothetical protein